MRQQCVPLPLDETAVLPCDASVFLFAHLVDCLAQMVEDVELVVQDGRPRGMPWLVGGLAKRFPHIHNRQADFSAFLGAQPGEELVQVRHGTIVAAEPDGPAPLQVADHDAVLMPLGDGDLVDANDPRSGVAGSAELCIHVLLVQFLDAVPIEVEFLGHFFDGCFPTPAPYEEGKTLGIQRIVGEPVQSFALHGATSYTMDPAQGIGEVDTLVAAGEVPGTPRSLVVEGPGHMPAGAANSFFRRRRRVMSTARGSPKIPQTVAWGTKPGKR